MSWGLEIGDMLVLAPDAIGIIGDEEMVGAYYGPSHHPGAICVMVPGRGVNSYEESAWIPLGRVLH